MKARTRSRSATLRRRRIRRVLSAVLTTGVRVVLFPVTLLFSLLVLLWSVPFRLYGMYQRARHPFLCATALSRFLDEHDPAVGYWDLYCAFRYGGLSRTDSLFNAFYVRLSERTHRAVPSRRALPSVPEHPFGWYQTPATRRVRRGSALLLSIVTALPRILSYLPSRATAAASRMGRAMENSHTAIGDIARFFARRAALIVPLLLGIGVGAVMVYYTALPLSFEVKIDGQVIGYVESRTELAEALGEVERTVSDSLGTSYKLPETITYSLSKSVSVDYLSKTQLVDALSSYTEDHVRVGYALYIDGALAAASEQESSLRTLLTRAEELARRNVGSEDVRLLNETRILYQNCPADAFMTDEELEGLLLPLVGENSTVVSLSAYTPPTVPTVRALSDGQAYCYTLSYGDTSSYEEEKHLSLVFGGTRIEEEIAPVAYSITYRESDTVYEGAQYVYQKGAMGEKLISYTVYYSGETVYEREVLSEAIVKEPIDQIILIGTKPLPTFSDAGTGNSRRCLIPPVYGEISSYFGLRDMDGDGILESGHSGIDIPAPVGTPLYACMGGVVLEAGPTGNSYGTAVKILHPNGLTTYYAHLSAVTVKVGQTVSQNQMIGNVGTTGFVTGPHVHLEVRLANGTQVNPVLYMIGY